MERYLEDRRNHSYEVLVGRNGENIYKHALHVTSENSTCFGKKILMGYQGNSTLNAKHNPALQSARTLRTVSSTKSIHALLHDVPGCAGILIAAMSRLGHGDLSLEDLTQMVKHVHMTSCVTLGDFEACRCGRTIRTLTRRRSTQTSLLGPESQGESGVL